MKPRERVLTALKRGIPDRLPYFFTLCPSLIERLALETGSRNASEYFDFEVRHIGHNLFEENPLLKHSPFYQLVKSADKVNEWGVGFTKGSVFHFDSMTHPLAKAGTLAEIESFPFPLVTHSQLIRQQADKTHDMGYASVGAVAPMGGTVFWPAYKLRGMEEFLVDLIENPEIAEFLLDKVTSLSIEATAHYVQSGIDILWLADDFGTQRDLMMSPRIWRNWFKPRLLEVVTTAKHINPNVLVALHSDGNIQAILPDLIEIGIDVLNPLQPECMDIVKIKKDFGKHLAFWGGIGTQTTMPFGTTNEVYEAVKNLKNTVGSNGGLLIAPTHLIEPETPWENILAFVDAVNKYGVY